MAEPLSEAELIKIRTTGRWTVGDVSRMLATIDQLQADLKRAEDAHASECEKLGVVSLLPGKWRKIAGVGKDDYAETLKWAADKLERALVLNAELDRLEGRDGR